MPAQLGSTAEVELAGGGKRDHEGIQVISRAAAVLRRLAGERDGLTVIDIARGLASLGPQHTASSSH